MPPSTRLASNLVLSLCVGAAVCGCSAAGGPADPTPSGSPATAPSPSDRSMVEPWAAEPLQADEVPPVLLAAWRAAENRATCAPLAPTNEGAEPGERPPVPPAAEPRRATFGGGWGVAWDLPGLRSAFGVAGTGVEAAAPTYDEWPHRLQWEGGSSAGYGPEGGTGPKDLAYLRVAGQGCLYNVWSLLGVEHLERLLGALRFVETETDG